MKHTNVFRIIALPFCVAVIFSTAAARPLMKLDVTIEPEQQLISARVLYSGLPPMQELKFFLNGAFVVDSIMSGGREADYSFDADGESPAYIPAAKPLTVRGPGREVALGYSGHITETINGVNMITPDLVELAIYAGWYPFNHSGLADFDYELDLRLPEGYTLVTNGRIGTSTRESGFVTHHFNTTPAGSGDILILASPRLTAETMESEGLRVEIYHSERGGKLAGGALPVISEAAREFGRRFGRAGGMETVRVAYSPRAGWGYSRLPVYVVSEERALGMLENPFGREDDLEGGIHEIAHFWWSIAGIESDWINEGLAEYSAFSFTAAAFGGKYAEHRIADYKNGIRTARTNASVLETPVDSPDRSVNWYLKSAVILKSLENRAGREKMDTFLSELYRTHRTRRDADTASFMACASRIFSPDELNFLKKYLDAPGWTEEDLEYLGKAALGAD